MITIGTDFSGIGAPEQALIGLGIKHKSVFACDVDRYAKQSFFANHKTETWFDDITQRDHKNTPYCDLYVAGFPCQAFSVAGKRKGFDDTRGTLFFDLFQYIDLKRPKYFVLENVKGLVRHDKGNTFKVIMDSLKRLNYTIYHNVLNTKHYGIPQNRERLFIIGFRESHEFEWPEPVELKLKIKDILQNGVNEKYYLSDVAINKIERHGNKSLKNEVSNTIHAGYYKMGGRDQQYIDVEWIADFRTDQGLRIRKNRLSPCLTTSATPIIKQKKIRRLTPLECLRLQGFPDSFHQNCVDAGVSDSQIYKQAGNSMTVNVMMALLSEILNNEKSV
jgi:DNA (cytosine-5)-methyltransferase 1